MKVLHLNTQFAALGGVEAVLRYHHRADHLHGMDSRFVSFWEAHHDGFAHARFLGFSPTLSIREARRRMAGAWPGFQPDVALHHTVWGQPFLLDLDAAPRRVLMLHSDIPGLDGLVARRLASMDGAIGVSDILVSKARQAAPSWEDERFLRIDYPVHPPAWLQPKAPRLPGAPLVLGFAGRLESTQKRVERFIELSSRLESLQVPWRLEFLGDGSQRSILEAALPNRERHRFLGRLDSDAYWRAITGWDAILFTSDFEGTPIALIEAISAGVLPFHPDLGCGGDQYARSIDSSLVYPPGDMEALARGIREFASWPVERHQQATAKAAHIALRHEPNHYLQRMGSFLRQVSGLGRPAPRPSPPRWFFPLDQLRFVDIERAAGLVRRIVRRN